MADPLLLLIAAALFAKRSLKTLALEAYASLLKNAVRLQRISRRRARSPRLGPAAASGGRPSDPDRGCGRSRPVSRPPLRGGKGPQGGLHRTAPGRRPRARRAAGRPLRRARPTARRRLRAPGLARGPAGQAPARDRGHAARGAEKCGRLQRLSRDGQPAAKGATTNWF